MKTLELLGVTKTYGNFDALSSVSFSLDPGEALYLYGDNGAGKTTLLEAICGIRRVTSGEIKLFGSNVPLEDRSIMRRVGVLFEDSYLYSDLTVMENIRFYGDLFCVQDTERRAIELFERLGLSDRTESPVKTLSLGLEKRCALSRALLHGPDLLILDEPASGLDAASRLAVASTLSGFREKGGTVVFTGHELELAGKIATKTAILEKGKLEFFGGAADGLKLINGKRGAGAA